MRAGLTNARTDGQQAGTYIDAAVGARATRAFTDTRNRPTHSPRA